VFVCLKCAGIHRSFGVKVSFIRSLTIDSWDDEQLLYLRQGGNRRFRDFLNSYNVPENATMDFKYMIRASNWYRRKLGSEISGLSIETAPDKISGLEMLEFNINPSPSIFLYKIAFDNSSPICSDLPRPEKKGGFFDKMSNFFDKAKDQVGVAVKKVGEKVKEMEIGDKLKSTGEKTIDIMKTAGGFVVEKGKEAYVK
jgi:hypothetical protein